MAGQVSSQAPQGPRPGSTQKESRSMADKARRRLPLVALIRRAVGRPYLLMAAVVLVLGTIWFTRLALQEFLLIEVQRDRTDKMLREHGASLEAVRANLREQETAMRDAEANLQRMRSLAEEGIVSQDRLDSAHTAYERARARLTAAQEQVRQAQEHYPAGDSPQMIRVHEKDLQRQQAEVKEQRAALEAARTK